MNILEKSVQIHTLAYRPRNLVNSHLKILKKRKKEDKSNMIYNNNKGKLQDAMGCEYVGFESIKTMGSTLEESLETKHRFHNEIKEAMDLVMK